EKGQFWFQGRRDGVVAFVRLEWRGHVVANQVQDALLPVHPALIFEGADDKASHLAATSPAATTRARGSSDNIYVQIHMRLLLALTLVVASLASSQTGAPERPK